MRWRLLARTPALVPLAMVAMLGSIHVLDGTPASADPVITAAGDIANDNVPNRPQRRTARLVTRIDPVAALTLGDNQYPDGALGDYESSYDPTWGRFYSITRPVPGNHEYHTANAAGYFDYFGKRAHRAAGGFYSFDIGGWHLVAVNTGAAPPSTDQLRWIRRDLRHNHDRCELAYWHHPRWSSGTVHGSDDGLAALWTVLFKAGVDVVLNGHEHNYERFAPLTPGGRVAPRTGIREFVVGTGGADLYPFGDPITGSVVRMHSYGVLRLRLDDRGYAWAFVRVGGHVLDRGRDTCHA
jgi:Calcineurin-like phosphoesterase